VKTRAMGPGSLSSGVPRWYGGGMQTVTKSASTWLLTAWRDMKSSSSQLYGPLGDVTNRVMVVEHGSQWV
jgi:hypothetical protein